MSREILQNIIEDFSPDKFIRFFREKSRLFAPRKEDFSQYNDEVFKDSFKLGEINFSPEEQLIICALKTSKNLSERSGKKEQYEKGKKILKERQLDAGIFIFYDKKNDFRFSLIYTNYLGKRRDWSNFRRFTYFVSTESTNKTFLQRIGIGDFLSLEKIKEAFSVEKVTKEFYQEYRKLFENLVGNLSSNHTFLNQASKYDIDIENFAKKLLGQIVFIYFIQRKGWMGVPAGANWGQGDRNFLINLFKKCIEKKDNFFNDYLEKLFYGTLNNARRQMVDPSFSKDFNCRIPFLNGGLFEAEYDWENSFVYLDNNIFKNIFEVFNRFNFTVEEENPDDKEIAVDPEMLGKVFENLLPENLRKGKGAYYTPREIVYYMCQHSLIDYLNSNSKLRKDKSEKCIKSLKENSNIFSKNDIIVIDKLLQDIKVCDPACGSGAFLVGMLNEIVRIRLMLQSLQPSLLSKKTEYKLKKDTIHNCIYGVDIDPGAIEIAKLRLWLSLVVEYELEDVEPLPNLDYRLMCGNSLREEFEGVKFYNNGDHKDQLTLFTNNDRQKKIFNLENKIGEYFDIHDEEEKYKKRKEINEIKDWLIRTALEKRKKQLSIQKKAEREKANMLDKKSRKKFLSSWSAKFVAEKRINEVLDNLHNPKKAKPFFIWNLEFIDVFEEKNGFDVMIANPPYVKEYVNKSAFDGIRSLPYYKGKMDLWYFFSCKSIDLLKESGILTFIAQNNWVTSFGASIMRGKVISDTKICQLLDFGDYKIFDTAGIQTMVMFLKRNSNADNYSFDYRRIVSKDPTFEDVLDLLNSKKTPSVEYLRPKINRSDYIKKPLTFSNPTIESILGKIHKSSNFVLNGNTEVAQGIVCPQDFVNKTTKKKLKNKVAIGEGIFILSNKEKNKLRLSRKELQIIKPFYTTKKLDRYYADPKNNQWIIYTDSKFKNSKEIFKYPTIKKHLDRFKKAITSDNRPYGLHRARDQHFFKDEKIISVRKCSKPSFTYTNFDCYVSATFYVIKTSRISMKFLVALLNSQLIEFWLKNKGKMQGNNYQIDKQPILDLPLIKPDKKSQRKIEEMVNKIFAITKSKDYLKSVSMQNKVRKYEYQLNDMVYQLYGLTKKDVQNIEENSN
ncbi:MAG: N-6 DNA methylase [Candidatus Omnitrophica bacterium]|nr:N-6 DNA methylase [Candidatus Omnitrophota bacterium]